MSFETDFNYVFRAGDEKQRPLLLLHGTGGNEHDLVGLADMVSEGRALLSPRGRVIEHGMPRFFRRFAEGVLDEDDIRFRAAELKTFIEAARAHQGMAKPMAFGFSNGANMAAALLALYPDLLAGAVLIRAMAPFKAMPEVALNALSVLLLSGSRDPMIPADSTQALAAWLKASGADLTHQSWPTGHSLVENDLVAARDFLQQKG